MTVTVCAVFQLLGVNVRDGALTVVSPVSPDTTDSTTSEVGCASSTTVNVSVEPASVTDVPPPDSAMVNPAVSSSVVVTVTV